MRFLNSSIVIVAIAPFIALALPVKDTLSSLSIRSQIRASADTLIASDIPLRREDRHNNNLKSRSSLLRPRGNNPSVLWRVGGSGTFVVVYPSSTANAMAVINVLDACYKLITHSIEQHGDEILPGGYFNWMGINGIALEAMNANNHQLTWGVLGAGISAVKQYMESNGYRQANFDIYDGINMVGKGLIYRPPYLQPAIGD